MTPNAELAYRTLDFIAAHPERWNQATWLLKEECGTRACFAGNAVLLSPEATVEFFPPGRDGFQEWKVITLPDGNRDVAVGGAALKLLGLEHEYLDELDEDGEYLSLFGSANSFDELTRMVGVLFGPRPAAEVSES